MRGDDLVELGARSMSHSSSEVDEEACETVGERGLPALLVRGRRVDPRQGLGEHLCVRDALQLEDRQPDAEGADAEIRQGPPSLVELQRPVPGPRAAGEISLDRPGGERGISVVGRALMERREEERRRAPAVEQAYALSPDPVVEECPGTYADFEAPTVNNRSFERLHTLGDIVTAIVAAGLRIEFLHEFDMTLFQRYGDLRQGEDGYFRAPEGRPRLPLMFSIKASRPV